ncbi:hypothetical protein Salat_1401500 [Sesamum alatum]|uniref:B box-type domain-containing protein n=1 Tax=Sesamum alatum TaxID=300844 RepID=A0AAE1YA59_9LAMI|nr:hypothetical protein Salat_1401500 [Sesamum alatum]
MVICSGGKPEWLESWLKTPFYGGRKCKTHMNQYNTIFCAVCMGSPVCETCWQKHHSKLHQGHVVLQVCSCSGRAAIDIQEMKKYMDASGIQVYKINGKDIFFLNPIPKRAKDHHHHDPKCQTCKRKIKDSNYLFCSIACKNYMSTMEYKMEILEEQPTRKRKSTGDCSSVGSMRKRSRKSIPSRAPFW